MDPISRVVAAGAAGAGAAGAALYVDDVFSTYLYDGTSATQTITNGIDLSGEGGMVWIKSTNQTYTHHLQDTERGASNWLNSASTSGSSADSNKLTAFNSDGFTLGSSGDVNSGDYSSKYASWTFRKAPGFFDVVTYTGNGTNGRDISHNLGSAPGMIVYKALSSVGGDGSGDDWWVDHRSLSSYKSLRLNETVAEQSNYTYWQASKRFDASVLNVNTNVNQSGINYVAYVFGHDDQSFGTGGDEAIIKCGSYTGNGSSSGPVVNLGFEPQWLLIKRTSATDPWVLFDSMRGMITGASDPNLKPNANDAEDTFGGIDLTATGFQLASSTGFQNSNGDTYIYIAIRRPHKPPEAGTDVLDIIARSGTGSTTVVSGDIEPVDFVITKSRNTTNAPVALTRLLGNYGLEIHATTAATTNVLGTSINPWDIQDGIRFTGDGDTNASGGFNYINYFFKRAAGVFDCLTYAGTGASRSVSHNLGVAPELIIVKRRDSAEAWGVDLVSESKNGRLNTTAAFGTGLLFDNGITSTTISTTNIGNVHNASGADYIAYLFATRAGISKVGVYAGQSSTAKNIDCGFTAGARFVLIKNISTIADWYLWDSTRGIVSGNDPFLYLNASSAEATNTDYIDPLNAGFTITSSAPIAINRTNQNFLFLAIA